MRFPRRSLLAFQNEPLPLFTLLGDFGALGFQLLFGQRMARGNPGCFVAGAEVLHPAGRPFVQIATVCAVQVAAVPADERDTMNLPVHDRSFAVQIKPGFFQSPRKFLLWKHGRFRRRGLFRHPDRQRREVSAFRRVPELVILVPLRAELLCPLLFLIGNGEKCFFRGRSCRNAHSGYALILFKRFAALRGLFRLHGLFRGFLLKRLFPFQIKDIFFDLFRVAAGPHNFVGVFFQGLNP